MRKEPNKNQEKFCRFKKIFVLLHAEKYVDFFNYKTFELR